MLHKIPAIKNSIGGIWDIDGDVVQNGSKNLGFGLTLQDTACSTMNDLPERNVLSDRDDVVTKQVSQHDSFKDLLKVHIWDTI